MYDYLKDFKFITYFIKNSKNDSDTVDAIICVEKQCLIIEQAFKSIHENIIDDLKKHNSLVINISKKIFNEETKEERQAKEEVLNIYNFFKKWNQTKWFY